MIQVAKFEILGKGSSKNAFTLVNAPTDSPQNFTLPEGSNINKFCLVEYTRPINWRKDKNSSTDVEFKKFREKMDNDPEFKYKIDRGSFFIDIIGEPQKVSEINYLKHLYDNHDNQYICIAELKKMFELSKESFAPKLHQIRIDVANRSSETGNYGIPFLPEMMDSEFEKIPSGYTKVSYLVERCDEEIFKFIEKNPDKKDETGKKVVEFIDLYVDIQNELNTDIKPANFCPTIADDGTVVAIRLLDVDPTFCVKGSSPEFKKNAKVFMKYLFIVNSVRWGKKINFGNLGITKSEIYAMINYFFSDEYFFYKRNPINMLYHYFAHTHPYYFLGETPRGWKTKISRTTGAKYFQNISSGHKQFNYPVEYEFLKYDDLKHYFNVSHFIKMLDGLNASNNIFINVPDEGGGGQAPVISPVHKPSVNLLTPINENTETKEDLERPIEPSQEIPIAEEKGGKKQKSLRKKNKKKSRRNKKTRKN